MLAMSLLLGCFEPATAAASMAIGKPKAIDDAPLAGRNAAEDSGGESFLFREEWASAQGKKVWPPRLRLRRSRRSRPSARSSQEEAVRSARLTPAAESLDVRYPPPLRPVQAGIRNFTGRTKGICGWPAFAGHDGWRVGTFGRWYNSTLGRRRGGRRVRLTRCQAFRAKEQKPWHSKDGVMTDHPEQRQC
jgi:hypothetical protein